MGIFKTCDLAKTLHSIPVVGIKIQKLNYTIIKIKQELICPADPVIKVVYY